MKFWVCSLCSMLFSVLYAQEGFKIYYEQTPDGYVILADNEEYSPVSVEVKFLIGNLKSSVGDTTFAVVPAGTKRFHIADLTVINRKKAFKLGYEVRFNHGDHTLNTYDKDFEYLLPFEKGATYWVSQGYMGVTSHQNEYALDFKMPMGTKIYAAREGVVVMIEESFEKSCTKPECAKQNNYILVYQPDGTFAEYTHIKKKGSIVKKGDTIKAGQLIGYSGNVGWATGPHLHFVVFYQRLNDRETVPVKFRINKKEVIQLEEKVQYTREF